MGRSQLATETSGVEHRTSRKDGNEQNVFSSFPAPWILLSASEDSRLAHLRRSPTNPTWGQNMRRGSLKVWPLSWEVVAQDPRAKDLGVQSLSQVRKGSVTLFDNAIDQEEK